jgi:hypothetical protein
MLWWGWRLVLSPDQAGIALPPPHAVPAALEVIHKNEETGSKDHDDYDESEQLCR